MFISDYFAMKKFIYWYKYHNTFCDVLQHLMTLFSIIFPYFSLIFIILFCMIIPFLYSTSTHLLCNDRHRFVAIKVDSFCFLLQGSVPWYTSFWHIFFKSICKYKCGFRFGIGLIKANCLLLIKYPFLICYKIRLQRGRF